MFILIVFSFFLVVWYLDGFLDRFFIDFGSILDCILEAFWLHFSIIIGVVFLMNLGCTFRRQKEAKKRPVAQERATPNHPEGAGEG